MSTEPNSKRAAATLMDKLHAMTAETMLSWLESGEAGPAEVSAILKFLKDNNVSVASPATHSRLQNLKDKLPFGEEDGPFPLDGTNG